MGNQHLQYLISRLDAFIRKYYLNKVIRGSLFTVAIALSAYLLFSILEYYLFFPPLVRKVLFFIWVGSSLAMLGTWVVLPLLKWLKLGKTIDHETAAVIIGRHFPEVEDRLLNILQLSTSEGTAAQKALIEASIDQKINTIRPVPLQNAIDFKKNRKYLRYAVPPLVIVCFLLLAAPNILIDSNYRYIRNNQWFEREAPFRFRIENEKLEVLQYEDFELTVSVGGNVIPGEVSLLSDGENFRMERTAPGEFRYVFRTVPSARSFRLQANGFNSASYELKVIPRPVIQYFDVDLDFPAYTQLEDKEFQNTGDLTVPEGTAIYWSFQTAHIDALQIGMGDSMLATARQGKSGFQASFTALRSTPYTIRTNSAAAAYADTIVYNLRVVPDAHPRIEAEQVADSLDAKQLFFAGEAEDDYGISRLQFVYTLTRNNEKTTERESVSSGFNASRKTTYSHGFNMSSLDLKPGDQLSYYFEVWDNDAINGSKSARSKIMQYRIPTIEELEEMKDAGNDKVESELEKALEDVRDIRRETDELQEKLLQKKELDWEDRKQIENLLEKQQSTSERIEDLKEQFKKNLEMEKEFLEPEESLLEKQQQLEQLFEEVLDEEMKKLFEELQELLEQLNKEQSLEEMEEMDLSNEQLEQELDRMLELFKQMQMDEKLQEAIEDLEKLAEEQEQLSEETLDKQSDMEENLQKQEEINEQFEELRKDMEEMRELNEELENSRELEEMQEQEEGIQEKLDDSKEQLENNKRKQAGEQQQNAAQEMKQMAQQMQQLMQQQQMEQQQEDMQALQQLLDNLIKLSVDQEQLIYDFKATRNTNPRYVDLMEEQQRIKEDTKLVEDSLMALSKRVMQISSFITREMREVNKQLESSLEALHERATDQAGVSQQFTMTGYNNLALMLDEVMQQMQEQMAQSMPGAQMCQKPGGQSQLPSMGEMQKQLNEQLQKMKGQMSEGPKPGQRQGMSQQLAEMARKQAALREALQQMADELGGGGTEDGELAKQLREIAEKMDKTEEDIVNKQLTEQTLKRQEEILTRLLEAADADRERKQDKKRESNTADETPRKMPPALEEYLRQRNAETDLFKSVAPELKPFYKRLVEEYVKGAQ